MHRLALAWLVISALLGGLVYYLETERIDDLVLGLAIDESRKLIEDGLPLINSGEPAALRQLKEKVEVFVQNHFVVVEVYDRGKHKIVDVINPRYEWVEDALQHSVHSFPVGEEMLYEKHFLREHLALQVFLPLRDAGGGTEGYFEGVYLVDDATYAGIRERVVLTLVITLFGILATTLLLYPIIMSLNRDVLKFSRHLLKGNIELMEVLGSAIAKRDSDTNIHNYRVSIYSLRLAEACGLETMQIRYLISGAFLHDVGKIGISDNILLKPGKLTAEEFKVMQDHVAFGVDILAKSNWLQGARDVVEFHHEKFNGAGYPHGLAGENIPINARIFAIVDVFDALTSERPYKEAMPFDEAMAILREDSGSHFDPRLIDAFAGIAEPLYLEIRGMSEKVVEEKLQALIGRYFFAGLEP
jgi:HD-GYP domain-containing protein (c-di-GMP phosphodiesterase class II)